MKFDIARQPLVPAFLTLFVLAVFWVCSLDTAPLPAGRTGLSRTSNTAPADPDRVEETTPQRTAAQPEADSAAERRPQHSSEPAAATAPARNSETDVQPDRDSDPTIRATETEIAGIPAATIPAATEPERIIPTPDEALRHFQSTRPGWAKLIAVLLVLFAGMSTGRLTIRYNLYTASTCLAIPLCAIVVCGTAAGSEYLAGCTAAALLAAAAKNYCRSFRNGYGFDALFRAALYTGLLLLTAPESFPLLLLLPLSVVLFRRTLREITVACAGLLLAPLLLCYINWALGGTFAAPIAALGPALTEGSFFGLFATLPLSRSILLGTVVAGDLLAINLFLSNLYAVGTKPRFILIFHTGMLALVAGLLCGPGATAGSCALLAVPSAVLLPLLFVRMSRSLSTPLYLILLAETIAAILP